MADAHKIWNETHQEAGLQVWETADVDQSEAFDFYWEGICAAFMPLRPELDRERRSAFKARVESYQLAHGTLNIVRANAHSVFRGKTEIAASPDDCFYLNFQLAGECRVHDQGETMILNSGDVGIFDGSVACALDHSGCEHLGVASLVVSKALLAERGLNIPQGRAMKLSQSGVYGALLRNSARAYVDTINNPAQRGDVRLGDVLLNLAALAAEPSDLGSSQTTRPQAHYFRLQQLIEQKCDDCEFNIRRCAQEAGLSVGYIHNLFAAQNDGFGVFLRQARLKKAARLLTSGRHAHLPVSSIAYLAGFKDASHFGRVFRDTFDLSPAEWRRRNLKGLPKLN